MNPKIVFRADGNSSIGLGHVMRLIALADMLKPHFYITFAVQNCSEYIRDSLTFSCDEIVSLALENDFENEARIFVNDYLNGDEIVVLDGYHFTSEYQKIIKTKCKKLVYIDDLHSWHHYADVVINHAESLGEADYQAEPYTKFYLGMKYALLRKEFLFERRVKKNIPALNKVFVSMGGADVHNVSKKIVEVLAPLDSIKSVVLLIGKVNNHHTPLESFIQQHAPQKFQLKSNLTALELCDILDSCHLAICPASTTAIEACAVGIGMISGYTADNQAAILNGLDLNKCLLNLGNLITAPVEQIRAAVLDLIENTEPLVKMMIAQNELLDKKSPERLLQIFRKLT